jgi:NAD(P)-dependent dehydrogenase (short-subunit alcohol dehydrogenase family)
VVSGIDLHGLRAVVTGASSGIGAETARVLAAAGADVTLAVRDTTVGGRVADSISASATHPAVAATDLADPKSVARFARNWDGPLYLLVNNAGLVTGGLERTNEGWEFQFATNHLGHFALAWVLHGALAQGARDRGTARIVSLSSTAHMRAPVGFGDIHFERRPYDPQIAYAQSKTANSLFAVEATRRWGKEGIVANAVNPGGSGPACSGTSRGDSGSHWTPRKPPASLPTRPPGKVRRPLWWRPPLRSSNEPAATTWTTAVRPTPCPTTQTWPPTRTASRNGHLTRAPPANSGRCQSRRSTCDLIGIPHADLPH